MKAILHIPSGELVEFIRLNAKGTPSRKGLYVVFEFNNRRYSPLYPSNASGPMIFRTYLRDDEHTELLLRSLLQCEVKFLAEEFTIIDL